MKEVSLRVFWILVSVAIMGWVTYQSWTWFMDYKSPAFSVVYSQSVVSQPPVYPLQPAEQVQRTERPQVTAPNRYVQPDTEKAVFTKKVCSAAELEAINREMADIEALLEAKPSFAYDTEYGTRLAELQNTCK